MKRIFWRFTVYYCSVIPWKITVILPFTAVLRIPTSYSLELTSRKTCIFRYFLCNGELELIRAWHGFSRVYRRSVKII